MLGNIRENQEVSGNTRNYQGIPGSIMKYKEVSGNTVIIRNYQEVSDDTRKHHKILVSRSTRNHQRLPRNIRNAGNYQGIPGFIRE